MDAQDKVLVSRFGLQVLVALGTLAFGGVIIFGALEYDVGWGERGPEPGYFPFWMGLLVVAGSLGTLAEALLRRGELRGVAISRAQATRALAFAIPVIGFVAVTTVLGLYVATVLYLFGVMVLQGGYRVPIAATISLGTALSFYLMFEKWLLVPLMKGPIEAWLGIH